MSLLMVVRPSSWSSSYINEGTDTQFTTVPVECTSQQQSKNLPWNKVKNIKDKDRSQIVDQAVNRYAGVVMCHPVEDLSVVLRHL